MQFHDLFTLDEYLPVLYLSLAMICTNDKSTQQYCHTVPQLNNLHTHSKKGKQINLNALFTQTDNIF